MRRRNNFIFAQRRSAYIICFIGPDRFLSWITTSTDTPIFDTAVREQVTLLAPSFETRDRYVKAAAFRGYLQAQWQAANMTVLHYDFVSLVQSQSKGFEQVKAFIDRGGLKRKER